MRKTLLLLLAVLMMPVMAVAQTNQAISKAIRTSSSTSTERRLYVQPEIIAEAVAGNATHSYTLGAWINISAYLAQSGSDAVQDMIVFGYGGRQHCNTNGCWNLAIKDGDLEIVGWGTQGTSGSLSTNVSLDTWHHIALAYDAAAPKMSIYLDGALVAEKAMEAQHKWLAANDEFPAFYFWAYGAGGLFDEAQIWNKALTAEEIANAYVSASLVDGLVGLYTFDETPATAGEFPNMSRQACASTLPMYHELCTASGSGCVWNNGLVYLLQGDANYAVGSVANENPTLVEGREIAPAEVMVMVSMPEEGGSLVVKNGEETLEEGDYSLTTGTELTLTATPEEGWSLIDIIAVDMNTMAQTVIPNGGTYTVMGDVTLTARFTNEAHTLTVVNALDIPYSLTRNGEPVQITDNTASLLGAGAEYQLSLILPSDKVLNAVRLGDTELTAVDGVYTITLDADATLTIDARAKANYTVTFAQPTGGTVGATYERVTGTGTMSATVTNGMQLAEGTVVTLTNTPAAGYQFVKYTVNGADNAGSFTLTADTEISALFEEAPAAEYTEPSGDGGSDSNCYVERASTTGAAKDVVISRSQKNGSNWELCEDDIIQVNPGSSFTMNWLAKYTNTTTSAAPTPQDLRYCIAFVFVDWNADGTFELLSRTGLGAGQSGFAGNVKANYDLVMNITQQFDVPADATPGRTRIRIIYTEAWDGSTGTDGILIKNGGSVDGNYQSINKGYSYDYLVDVVPAVVAEHTVSVVSANEALGTVAIVDPATDEKSVTTTQGSVTVVATPAENAAFLNWTVNDEVVSTDATYTYVGESDVELVANFGYTVTYTVGAEGSALFTIDGAGVTSGDVVAVGSELTITVTPETGKEAELTVNGVAVALANNTTTVEITENTEIAVAFVNAKYTFTLTVVGQGDVQVWNYGTKAKHPNVAAAEKNENAVRFNDGDEVAVESNLKVYLKPAEGWSLESATYDKGNGEATAIDGWFESTATGLEGYQFKALARTAGNVIIAVTFTEDSTSAIEGIGIDPENGPVEYFNLQGVQVSGENLAPGFYIVRQGEKTAKILVK